jgi:hypothetical protein
MEAEIMETKQTDDKSAIRDMQLADLAEKQKIILDLITWADDNFAEYLNGGNLLKQKLTGASADLHAMTVNIAEGKSPNVSTPENAIKMAGGL